MPNGRLASAPVALFAAAILGLLTAACDATPQPTAALPSGTTVPLDPTPWPNGTVGRSGLRIEPALLLSLPSIVSGQPLVEQADLEVLALDNADLPASFEALAAAGVGSIGEADWLRVTVGRLRETAATDDFYAAWRDQYDQGACSQAGGVQATAQEAIGEWSVDVATCGGGPVAYTLRLDPTMLVSITDLGPRRLGRQLIAAIP